jgi:hypothetical protein
LPLADIAIISLAIDIEYFDTYCHYAHFLATDAIDGLRHCH